MICNEFEPMCIAGVFGGVDSGVTESTTKVFIESAVFNPVWIRKTARRYGLNTDASFRFERGIDPDNVLYVLKRAAMMIKDLSGGTISSNIVDIYPKPIEGFKVSLSLDKVHRLTGKDIPAVTVKSILSALEIQIISEKDGVLELKVPAYRVDVQRDVDVIEDILRIYGYNNIEFSDNMNSTISYSKKPDSNKIQNIISGQLTDTGFNEILNNSLTAIAYYNDLQSMSVEECVRIMNPLSNDLNVLRQSLLFGGLESIAYNRNRRKMDLKFYEFGNCYHYKAADRNEEDRLAAYSEEMHLGLWLTGFDNGQIWNKQQEKVTVYDLKAYVENIFSRLGINREKLVIEEGSNDIYSHSLSYSLKNGRLLAVLGNVRSELLKKFDIDSDVYYADMLWNDLIKATKKDSVHFSEIPKFPEVRRDLALLLDNTVHFTEIEKIAYATEKKLLTSVSLFDVYEGKNLPAGKKSYAVSFMLQDTTQTLNDKQIDTVMNKLINNFERQLGASLR
jgi:phenylalanyl-tRNA synthetase beta chain